MLDGIEAIDLQMFSANICLIFFLFLQ